MKKIKLKMEFARELHIQQFEEVYKSDLLQSTYIGALKAYLNCKPISTEEYYSDKDRVECISLLTDMYDEYRARRKEYLKNAEH